uniref:ShKT domain-containing protein n=1 Tax=Bursaphelenchus xylophilus TaxID=6326 RepID=A0A1I7SX05_BURXY
MGICFYDVISWLFISSLISTAISQKTCSDQHIHCVFWANQGECEKNAVWMLPNCQKACKSCDIEVTTPKSTDGITFVPPIEVTKKTPTETATKRPKDDQCPVVQVKEVQTRFVPTDPQFRTQAQRGCAIPNQLNICSRNVCYNKVYRTLDGSCNHHTEVMRGAAYTPYLRLLDANYADGFSQMQTAGLPNPRAVTHRLLTSTVSLQTSKSAFVTVFAQFIMHDITKNTLINVCQCGIRRPECANIEPDVGDRRRTCVPVTRSTPMCMTGVSGRPRIPVNENTAYIDGSAVYGSDPTTGDNIRVGAFMRTQTLNRDVVPPLSQGINFDTGDDRASIFVGLLSMHSIFLRMHNRLAQQLSQINPRWNVDRVYQEVRKIQGAVLQAITYNELLPAVLGGRTSLLGEYSGFNEDVDPGIAAEFAGAAGRQHGLVQESYPLVNDNFQVVGTYTTASQSGNFDTLRDRGAALILRGYVASPTRKPGRVSTTMTEFLFGGQADMASINIMRGRDYGLRTYNDYRVMCGLPKLKSYDDWAEVADPKVRERVSQLYPNINKLELYVGGILEEPRQGSLLGPTFSCIWADQFRRIRDGDNFFYKKPGVFTDAQQESIDQISLARIICETTEINRIPENVFNVDQTGKTAVPCSQIPSIDLKLWKE